MGCFVNFRVFAYGWNTDVIKHREKEQKKKMKKKKQTLGGIIKNIVSLPTLPERNY